MKNRKIKLGIFTFNFGKNGFNSITTQCGPIKINSKGRISIKKGPISLSFKIQKNIVYIISFIILLFIIEKIIFIFY